MTDVAVRTRLRSRLGVDHAIGAVGVLCGLVAAWAAAGVDVAAIGDGGLAPALPPAYWFGLVGLNIAFVVSLRRPQFSPWLSLALIVGLVLVIYGPGSLVSDIPRNAVSWRHLGVSDALARGVFDPNIDVYFNWPGFFAGLATFIQSTGLTPQQVASWAPIVNIALWALAVAAVLRLLAPDRTTVLLGVWLFLIGNWIDQDYLAPQALGFLLHLAVLVVAMSFLGARVQGAAPGRKAFRLSGSRVPEHENGRLRRIAFVVALLLSAALVPDHQLTPVVLACSLAALALVRRSWAPMLPVILTLFLVLWLLYPASAYLAGHPIFGGGEQQAGLVQSNVTGRVVGTPDHLVIQGVRMGLTLAMWVLAFLGAVRYWRAGRRDLRPYALAVFPFLMLPSVSYGGEMLLRVTLFALPFTAFFAARFLAAPARQHRRAGMASALTLVVVLSVLSAASVAARYGNARFDMFTADEVQAVEELYDVAEPGSVVVAGATSTPWASQDYERYTRRSVQQVCAADLTPGPCAGALHDLAGHEASTGGITLLLTRGNQASLEMQGQMADGQFARFETRIRRMSGTRLVFVNDDARIYHLAP